MEIVQCDYGTLIFVGLLVSDALSVIHFPRRSPQEQPAGVLVGLMQEAADVSEQRLPWARMQAENASPGEGSADC